MSKIEIRMLTDTLPLPDYGSHGAAGMDLRAKLDAPVQIEPGHRLLIPTGIAIGLHNPGLVALIAPRSGLALKHGIQVHPGVIDSDYTGEIGVIVFNFGQEPFTVNHGDRIAQMLIQPVQQAQLIQVDEFSVVTVRGANGFGSTGTN